jgi:hypothetical protein
VALRLARHVEHTIDVDGMLDRMTHQQFAEWVAYDSIEPIGGEPDRHLLAFLATVAGGMAGCDVTFEQLLPWWKKPKETAASPDQVQSFLQSIGMPRGNAR